MAYMQQHDSTPPSLFIDETGFHIGTWVVGKRHRYRLGRLSSDHIRRLEAITGWTWDNPLTITHKQLLDGIKKKAEEATDASWQKIHNLSDKEWSFLSSCRNEYKHNKLKDETKEFLSSLPYWLWSLHESKWNRSFDDIKTACALNKSVSSLCDKKHRSWIKQVIRMVYDGKLSKERVERLKSLPGFRKRLRLFSDKQKKAEEEKELLRDKERDRYWRRAAKMHQRLEPRAG